jgi:hypothetical protein
VQLSGSSIQKVVNYLADKLHRIYIDCLAVDPNLTVGHTNIKSFTVEHLNSGIEGTENFFRYLECNLKGFSFVGTKI